MAAFRIIAAFLTIGLAQIASSAFACNIVPGSESTSLTLTHEAQAIVIGRVVASYGFGRAQNSWFDEAYVVVDPIYTLKGSTFRKRFDLEDAFAPSRPYPGDPEVFYKPSDFMELSRPHPQTFAGGCVRGQFVLGQLVLFFLDWYDGKWRLSGTLGRSAEDVPSVNAPWVRLAQLYIRTLTMPPGMRAQFLKGQRDLLRRSRGDRAASLIAADIDRQLADPKNRKLLSS